MEIAVQGIVKRFGSFLALDDVSLAIPSGKLVALLGPSGSGKTTLLRVIAGLEVPDVGRVFFDGEDVTQKPIRSRNAGFVFQQYALFREMNVFDNISFGLRMRHRSKVEVRQRTEELLSLIGLKGYEKRMPSQLSGGQRQRVALARAMATQPGVLLLDEPFAALDAKVRGELRRWLRRLHDQLHVTTVLVTHDREEATEVADEIVILSDGRIEQVAHPDVVRDAPCSPFVMDFMSNVNTLPGSARAGKVKAGALSVDCPEYLEVNERDAFLYFHPHQIRLTTKCEATNVISLLVVKVRYVAGFIRVEALETTTNSRIEIEVPREDAKKFRLQSGDRVFGEVLSLHVFIPDVVESTSALKE